MIICCKCAREMCCEKTGAAADFDGGHVYAGDKFKCSECGVEIIRTNAEPHFDPHYNLHTEYFKMRVKHLE